MTLISPAPSAGATTGTEMNTAMANAISRAMSSATNRSRIVATAITRRPAAPRPHTNRAHNIQCRLGTTAAPDAPPTNSAHVARRIHRRPKRSASRPNGIGPTAMPEEERRDQSCRRGRVGGQTEVATDSTERRKDQIDRDRRRRHRQPGERTQLEARRLSTRVNGYGGRHVKAMPSRVTVRTARTGRDRHRTRRCRRSQSSRAASHSVFGDLAVAGNLVAEHQSLHTGARGDATRILRRRVRLGEVIDDVVAIGELGDALARRSRDRSPRAPGSRRRCASRTTLSHGPVSPLNTAEPDGVSKRYANAGNTGACCTRMAVTRTPFSSSG